MSKEDLKKDIEIHIKALRNPICSKQPYVNFSKRYNKIYATFFYREPKISHTFLVSETEKFMIEQIIDMEEVIQELIFNY